MTDRDPAGLAGTELPEHARLLIGRGLITQYDPKANTLTVVRDGSPWAGWIACSDRLPDPGVDVLALYHSGECLVLYIHQERPGVWYPGGMSGGWVTHWQPLPPKL